MQILIAPQWSDYQLIDSGASQRLEKFGEYILIRPDPQAIWKPGLDKKSWEAADIIFERTSGERGRWKGKVKLPDKWVLRYKDISFYCKLSPFKHTGLFPEQAVHWDWISSKLETRAQRLDKETKLQALTSKQPNVLNLFAYTGLASLVAAASGAKVTHVDGSYPSIGWARENQKLSGLEGKAIRWILDDCLKFCQREVKRGQKYDGIIIDPPIYGHGPKGERWDFNKDFPKLMSLIPSLLTPKPLFVIVNAYAISSSALMLENVLKDHLSYLNGSIDCGELALKDSSGRLLSTGIFARWSK